jgi:ferrous iron transport protein B
VLRQQLRVLRATALDAGPADGRRLVDRPWPALAITLAPLVVGVGVANLVAGQLDPIVRAVLAGPVSATAALPDPAAAVLAGDFGLLTMGPLLIVWALPTVVVVAVLQAASTASGLSARLSQAVDPLTRRVGLQGQDLVAITMGFGCNVPAVIASRSCSTCTRDTTLATIAWGAACSYQLPATAAVFAAAGRWWLVLPYLGVLVSTTVVYAWANSRHRRPRLVRHRPTRAVVRPDPRQVAARTTAVVGEFVRRSLPVFCGLTLVAALIDRAGVVDRLSTLVAPLTGFVGLPPDVVTPVLLSAVRKDGILLLEQTAPALTSGQLLTAVVLAGGLVPCLMTTAAIARERGVRMAGVLVGRQAAFAMGVAVVLALVTGGLR